MTIVNQKPAVEDEIHNIREFIREIEHSYNNVLGAISGYLELLEKKLPSVTHDTEKITKYLAIIKKSNERAIKLTAILTKFAHTGVYDINEIKALTTTSN